MSTTKDRVIARMPSWLFFLVCLVAAPSGAAVLFVFGTILSIIFRMENEDSGLATALVFSLVGLVLPIIVLRRMRRSLPSPATSGPSMANTTSTDSRRAPALEPQSSIVPPAQKTFQLRRAFMYICFVIFIIILIPIFLALVEPLWKPMPFEAKKTCSLAGCSIFIQSTDSTPLIINGYVANKGVCRMPELDKRDLPKTLRFGEMWIADVTGCQVLEFSLNTDKGTWTVTWSN